MPNSKPCPDCSQPIPPDAPGGMCPSCLLRGARHQAENGMGATSARPSSLPPAPQPAELQKHFPQLEIVELIGAGGMGAVYRARQTQLDRWIALKVFREQDDPALAERFLREAQALARLSHPNIVTVYDFGSVPGYRYLTMEYVDGPNLRQVINAKSLTAGEALQLAPQLCDALQYAHEHGVVHRDIKPENVLLDMQGRLKVADFGLAKLMQQGANPGLTHTQQVMGTWSYMAPEQMERPLDVDHRADIYSLGVILYELLTGELPMGRFAPPSRKSNIDSRLDEVVMRALEKEPGQRYQHVSDFRTDMQRYGALPPVRTAEYAESPEPMGKPLPPKPAGPHAQDLSYGDGAPGWLNLVVLALPVLAMIFGVFSALFFVAGGGSFRLIDRSISVLGGVAMSIAAAMMFVVAGDVRRLIKNWPIHDPQGQAKMIVTLALRFMGFSLASFSAVFFVASNLGFPQLPKSYAVLAGIATAMLGGGLIAGSCSLASFWAKHASGRSGFTASGVTAIVVRGGGAVFSTLGVLCFIGGGLEVFPKKIANFSGIALLMLAGGLWSLAHRITKTK